MSFSQTTSSAMSAAEAKQARILPPISAVQRSVTVRLSSSGETSRAKVDAHLEAARVLVLERVDRGGDDAHHAADHVLLVARQRRQQRVGDTLGQLLAQVGGKCLQVLVSSNCCHE